jgi:hypothetical protein
MLLLTDDTLNQNAIAITAAAGGQNLQNFSNAHGITSTGLFRLNEVIIIRLIYDE